MRENTRIAVSTILFTTLVYFIVTWIRNISFGIECKMEFKCLMKNIDEVKELIKSNHPNEESVINVIPILS